jgi:hypothetical protein
MADNPRFVCIVCGSTFDRAERITKGSFLIEVLLWLFFIIPGIIYGIWRLSSRYDACPACGASNFVPTDTPMGQKLLENLSHK